MRHKERSYESLSQYYFQSQILLLIILLKIIFALIFIVVLIFQVVFINITTNVNINIYINFSNSLSRKEGERARGRRLPYVSLVTLKGKREWGTGKAHTLLPPSLSYRERERERYSKRKALPISFLPSPERKRTKEAR